MQIKPDAEKVLEKNAIGRESSFLLAKKGIKSGMVVIDIAHIPNPACGSRAALHLFGENEQGQSRLYLVDLNSWDPVNTLSLKQGKMSIMPVESCKAISDGGGNGFANGFNSKGGVKMIASWTATEAKVWLDVGKNIKSVQAVNGKAPATLDMATLGAPFWSNKMCTTKSFISALTGPEQLGPMEMKVVRIQKPVGWIVNIVNIVILTISGVLCQFLRTRHGYEAELDENSGEGRSIQKHMSTSGAKRQRLPGVGIRTAV